jgi:hypothetical protein
MLMTILVDPPPTPPNQGIQSTLTRTGGGDPLYIPIGSNVILPGNVIVTGNLDVCGAIVGLTLSTLCGEVFFFDACGAHTLKAIDNDLYYDNEILARVTDISNVEDWSLYPMLCNVDANSKGFFDLSSLQFLPDTASNILTASLGVALMDGVPVAAGWANYAATTSINANANALNNVGAVNFTSATQISASDNIAFTSSDGGVTKIPIPSQWGNYAYGGAGNLNMSGQGISNTSQVVLRDGVTLSQNSLISSNNDLFFAGQLVQTGSALTLDDWANFPAVANVGMSGNAILNTSGVVFRDSVTLSQNSLVSSNNDLYFRGSIVETGSATGIANWANFPAVAAVNLSGSNVSNVGTITNYSNQPLTLGTSNGGVIVNSTTELHTTSNILFDVNGGCNIIDTADFSVGASNGYYGKIELLAKSGNALNLIENGGFINIEADSFIGSIQPTALSRVNVEAATLTLAAGALGTLAYVPGAINLLSGLGTGINLLTTTGAINIAGGTSTVVAGGVGVFFDGGATGVKVNTGDFWVNQIQPNGSAGTSFTSPIITNGVVSSNTGKVAIPQLDIISPSNTIVFGISGNQITANVSGGGGGAGVTTLNGLSGVVNISSGNNNIGVSLSGQDVVVSLSSAITVSTANITTLSALTSINGAAYPFTESIGTIYVSSSSGSDTTGNGTTVFPYATIAKALAVAGTIVDSTPISINLYAGIFTENVTITRANTFINGLSAVAQQCYINGSVTFSVNTSTLTFITGGLAGVRMNSLVCSGTPVVQVDYNFINCVVISASTIVPFTASQGGSVPYNVVMDGVTLLPTNTRAAGITSVTASFLRCLLSVLTFNSVVLVSGSGVVSLIDTQLSSSYAGTDAGALLSISNTIAPSTFHRISQCRLFFTSATTDVSGTKACVRFLNTVAVSALIDNCAFNCVGAITGTPLIQCIQKTGVGAVALTYGGIQAVSPAIWISPAITRTILSSVQQGVNAVGGGAGDFVTWDGNQWATNSPGTNTVSIGRGAGNALDSNCVNIGSNAGSSQNSNAVAIGFGAGSGVTSAFAVAVGSGAGTGAGVSAISVGAGAGTNSGTGSICIGGATQAPGVNSISIGQNAGNGSSGLGGCIVISADGTTLVPAAANTCKISPLRLASSTPTTFTASSAGSVGYNFNNKEVTYNTTAYRCSLVAGGTTLALNPTLNGSTYIVTGTGTLTITNTLLLADAAFFVYLKNGTTAAPANITLVGVAGSTTLYQPSASQNGQIVVVFWDGTTLTAY